MSESSDEQGTLEPTPRRRQKAREAGDVARSPALVSAVSWLVGIATLRWTGPHMTSRLAELGNGAWSHSNRKALDTATAAADLQEWLANGLWIMLPLLVAILAGTVCAQVLQTGWLWLPDRLAFRFERLSGGDVWQRCGDGETMRGALRDLLQVLAGIGVVAWRGWSQWNKLAQVADRGSTDLITQLCLFVLDTTLWAGAAWLLVGLADYALVWRRHELRLLMTPEEARQEAKEEQRPRARQRSVE